MASDGTGAGNSPLPDSRLTTPDPRKGAKRPPTRVVSLLPSATEIVHLVGAGHTLVGVTHECDYPTGVEQLPKLTASKIDGTASSADIDAAVRRLSDKGSLYALDAALLEELHPDLVITQGLCDVCAVSMNVVKETSANLATPPGILSLNPTSIEDVLTDLVAVGGTLGRGEDARKEVAALRERLARVEGAVAGLPRPRIACIEWLDPPFSAGHWVPEMVRLAGGVELLAEPGEPSRRMRWEEVFEADPEAILLMPCGFDAPRAVQEAQVLPELSGWSELSAVKAKRVWAMDANSYFSRPAPRLVEGVEILARILHPQAFPDAPDQTAAVRFDATHSSARPDCRPGSLQTPPAKT